MKYIYKILKCLGLMTMFITTMASPFVMASELEMVAKKITLIESFVMEDKLEFDDLTDVKLAELEKRAMDFIAQNDDDVVDEELKKLDEQMMNEFITYDVTQTRDYAVKLEKISAYVIEQRVITFDEAITRYEVKLTQNETITVQEESQVALQIGDWVFFGLDQKTDIYFSNEEGDKLSEDFDPSLLSEKLEELANKPQARWSANAGSANTFLTSGGYAVTVPIIRRSDNNQLLYCMQSSANFPVLDEYNGLGDPYHNDNIAGIFYYGATNDSAGILASKYGLSWDKAQYGTQVALWRKLHIYGYPANGYAYSNLNGDQNLINYINELSEKTISTAPKNFAINFDGNISQSDPQETTEMSITEASLKFSVSVDNPRAYVVDMSGNRRTSFNEGEGYKVIAPPDLIGTVNVTVKTEQMQLTPMIYGAKNGSTQSVGLMDNDDPIILENNVNLEFLGAVGGFKGQKFDNLGNFLKDVEFTLSHRKDILDPVKDIDGNVIKVITDQYGKFEYPQKVLLGEYELFETKNPNHVIGLKIPIKVTIVPAETIELPPITNSIAEYVQFEFFKYEVINGKDVGLVRTINIYRKRDKQLVDVVVTNSLGQARSIKLPANAYDDNNKEIKLEYYAVEQKVDVADYYYKAIPNIPLVGTEDENGVTHIDVLNERLEVAFSINKVDEAGKPIVGAEFEFFDDSNKKFGTVLTDTKGNAISPLIDIQRVIKTKGYARETKTGKIYILDSKQFVFPTIDVKTVKDKQVFKLNGGKPFVNKWTRNYFNKVDVTGEKEVCGATVEIKDKDGKTIEKWVSCEEDKPSKEITKLEKDTAYKFCETIVPVGNKTPQEECIEFRTDKDGKPITVEFHNELTSVEVIKKIEQDEPQAGNEIVIQLLKKPLEANYNYEVTETTSDITKQFMEAKEGDIVYTFTTTEALTQLVQGIPVGYQIAVYESKSVEGYELKGVEVTGGTILDDKVAILTIDNTDKRVIFKNGKVVILPVTGENTMVVLALAGVMLVSSALLIYFSRRNFVGKRYVKNN